MTDMTPVNLPLSIQGDDGVERPLNVTYHIEDDYPIVGGVVIDKALDLDGRPANLSDVEWERVWQKCETHKATLAEDSKPQ